MPGDYVTAATALALAYQAVAAERLKGIRRTLWTGALVVASGAGLFAIPQLEPWSLRLAWLGSGLLLAGLATRSLLGDRQRLLPAAAAIDTGGGFLALGLAGGPSAAIWAGALAGAILPLAVVPWPRSLARGLDALAVIGTGAVGLGCLLRAITGDGREWPLLLLAVPWLVIWDFASPARSARLARPKGPRGSARPPKSNG